MCSAKSLQRAPARARNVLRTVAGQQALLPMAECEASLNAASLTWPEFDRLRADSRDFRITLLRSSVHDPTHRLFLALLLNVPTREQLYKLIAERFPGDDPAALVVRWLEEIFSESRMSVKLNQSSVYLLRLMLQDPDFEHSKPALLGNFGPEGADEQKLREAWSKLLSVDMFTSLFGEPKEAALEVGA